MNREFGQDDSLTVRVARGSQVAATAPIGNPTIAAPIQDVITVPDTNQASDAVLMILLIIQAQLHRQW